MSHAAVILRRNLKVLWAILALAVISGCASVDIEKSVAQVNQETKDFTQGNLELVQTTEKRALRSQASKEILEKPLSQADAVRLALLNSPALQAMLAQNWAEATIGAQTGRIANPVLNLERLRFADELEIGRLLAFGLLDLLSLPQRYQVAQRLILQSQLLLTVGVIEHVTEVRQAWVKAVAAQQSLLYAQQVNDAAQASAELARRMQAVGNFTKLQRARQQAFYADAATRWAAAQHAATATRESLTRMLGLTDSQAEKLVLPDRLPDLPTEPRAPEEVSQVANSGRLDIKLAQVNFEAMAKIQGLTLLTSFTDIELGVRRDTVFDNASATSTTRRGFEVSVRLPIFDWGGNQRNAMSAQTLAAANRLEATVRAAGSNLRESYSAYRTAYDVSKHFRDEVVPLRKVISEENVLRYNGMLIGVFELLADSRDQVTTVIAAIAAGQQFWLADAALQASLMGKPTMTTIGSMAPAGSGNAPH